MAKDATCTKGRGRHSKMQALEKLKKKKKKAQPPLFLQERRSKEVNEDVNNLKWLRGYYLRQARAPPGEEKQEDRQTLMGKKETSQFYNFKNPTWEKELTRKQIF